MVINNKIRSKEINQTPQIEYCLYARKSSEDDERQAMSIDSQIKEMQTLAQRENLFVKEIREESHSAITTAGDQLTTNVTNRILQKRISSNN